MRQPAALSDRRTARSPSATAGSSAWWRSAGYLKNYHYDDRLKVILPPFLFSISTAGWQVSRETLCMPDTPATDSSSCAYTGP